MECRTDDLLWNADDYETQRAHMTRPPSLLAVFTFGGEVYSVSVAAAEKMLLLCWCDVPGENS